MSKTEYKYNLHGMHVILGMYSNQTGAKAVETKILMDWMEKNHPSVTVILRGGSQIITHPYYSSGQTG